MLRGMTLDGGTFLTEQLRGSLLETGGKAACRFQGGIPNEARNTIADRMP